MKNLLVFILLGVAVVAGNGAGAADDIRTERVQFPHGQTGTTIKGQITGRASVSYLLRAEAGQTMTVALASNNTATYFNVYEPGKGPGDEALAAGSMTGPMVPDLNRFEGTLPTSGEYTISVYLYRNAARRNERSDYTLDIAISAKGAATHLPAPQAPAGDALVPGTEFHATGNVPCARYAGQPMNSCRFGVVREGGGNGRVTLFWPDGGSRVIFFEAGTPVSFDQSQADGDAKMTVGRNVDLFMITIGVQRFEIPEAVISGG